MILLLSCEGPTDLGTSERGGLCRGNEFLPGPMARLVEQLLEPCLGITILSYARDSDSEWVYFLCKADLGQKARDLKNPKSLFLPGADVPKGALYYVKAAYALGLHAREIETQSGDLVMAVFFRDSDGTQTCPRTQWQDKRNAVEKGFEAAEFAGGVAMIPKPKSEAWLLCALQRHYQHCDSLEDESGNDDSPNSLKKQLAECLEQEICREVLDDLVREGTIVAANIQMPSFVAFKTSLLEAAQYNQLDVSAYQ